MEIQNCRKEFRNHQLMNLKKAASSVGRARRVLVWWRLWSGRGSGPSGGSWRKCFHGCLVSVEPVLELRSWTELLQLLISNYQQSSLKQRVKQPVDDWQLQLQDQGRLLEQGGGPSLGQG